MLSYPNAKINIGLKIGSKRKDGYHNLTSYFYPVPLCDILEIVPSEHDSFTQTGAKLEQEPSDNLVIQARDLFRKKTKIHQPLAIHLHKLIPTGAGLGGGSSDATFTLKMLAELFHLDVSSQKLAQWSIELGSDCPFFAYNQACLVRGRGEIIDPVDFSFSSVWLVLVFPKLHSNTHLAFQKVNESAAAQLPQLNLENLKTSADQFNNDFEPILINQHPVLAKIKSEFNHAGAIYSSLTGSGSAYFGVFESLPVLPKSITQFPIWTFPY